MMPSTTCGIVHMAPAKSRGRVLIVDDEPLVRWSLAAALRAAGFDPVTASCGAEAVAAACGRPAPAAALVDLELYDTDCFVLIERIHAHAPGCRILALTTSGPERPSGPSWAAMSLIRKPFDLADVVRLVESAVA